MKNCLGIVCQFLAVVVVVLGLIPLAELLNPWRKATTATQLDEIYFNPNLIQSAIIGLVGFVACFILFRMGKKFKNKS